MQHFWRAIMVGFGLLVVMETAVGSLQSAAWHSRLNDSEAVRLPNQPLRLSLPSDLPNRIRTALRLELDGVRIIDGVHLLADAIVYQPPQPMVPGSHRLLLEHAPAGGRRRELGIWHFTVASRAEAGPEYLPATGNPGPLPSGSAGPLSLEVVASAAKDVPSSSPADAAVPGVTPDRVIATLQTGSMMTRVGPQVLAYDSLINKDQADRGAVIALEIGQKTQLKGFGIHSNQRRGYQQMLGSDRASYGFNGLVVEHQLPVPGDDAIKLEAGWLSGTAHAEGADREKRRHAGEAWSLSADAALLQQRLQLQFEYAGSRYDWRHASNMSGTHAGETLPRSDQLGQAYSFTTELHSRKSAPVSWHLGTKLDQVTPWFGSLANPALNRDWRRLRAYGALSTGEWGFNLSLEQRRSNLEENQSKPVVQHQKGRLTAAWTASQAFAGPISGKPSIKLAADYGYREQIDVAIPNEAGLDRERTIGLMLQSELSNPLGLWGVRAKGGNVPDSAGFGMDARKRTLALELYGDLAAMALKPAVSWQRNRDESGVTTEERWRAGLRSGDIGLHDSLDASVNLAYQQRSQPELGQHDNGFNVGANLAWRLQRPTAGRSGLTLAISGSYLGGERNLTSAVGKGDYGFMLSLSTAEPQRGQ